MKATNQIEQQTDLKTNSNRLQKDYEKLLKKAQDRRLEYVREFLQTLRRGSIKTSLAFWYGLDHLDNYTVEYYKLDLQNIIAAIKGGQVDVYVLLNSFVTYLQNETKNGSSLTARTINNYMTAAKSYFEYWDIEITDKKYKKRVRLLDVQKEDEEAIDANDIREILNHCDNKRLKSYLLILASGGLRATEALAIRECDVDWSGINFADVTDKLKAAAVHIRKEYSKTKRARDIDSKVEVPAEKKVEMTWSLHE
jgi:integrase